MRRCTSVGKFSELTRNDFKTGQLKRLKLTGKRVIGSTIWDPNNGQGEGDEHARS